MSLVKHGNSGNWYFRFVRKGKVYFGSTGETNKVKAAKIEAAKIAEVESNEFSLPEITLGNALIQYAETKPGVNNVKSYVNKLVGASAKRNQEAADVYALDRLKPLHLLGTPDIQKLVMARRKEGMKNATVLYELTVLKQTIQLAKKLGYAIPDIDFAAIKGENGVRPDKHRIRFLTKDEEVRLLAEMNPATYIKNVGSNPERLKERMDAYHFVILLLDTGARHTEISSIEWKNIDIQNSEIHLYRSKVENESVIRMSARAKEVFKTRLLNKRPDQRFVFEARDGTARKHSPSALNSACKRAGIENCSFHILRHTLASRLVQAGIPLYDVSQILGHTSIAMTSKYAHLSPNQSAKRMVEVLDQINQPS